MISPTQPAENKAFRKAFLQGLTGVVLVYGLIYAWVAMNATTTMQAIEESLPSSIMLIDHAASKHLRFDARRDSAPSLRKWLNPSKAKPARNGPSPERRPSARRLQPAAGGHSFFT